MNQKTSYLTLNFLSVFVAANLLANVIHQNHMEANAKGGFSFGVTWYKCVNHVNKTAL